MNNDFTQNEIRAQNSKDKEQESEEKLSIIECIYQDLLEDVTLGIIFQVHRATKLGYLEHINTETTSNNKLSNESDNIFEKQQHHHQQQHTPKNQKYECTCPNCDRNLVATRFAPHLEKCMGLGRNSSRLASKKITSFSSDDSIDQLLDYNEAIQTSLAFNSNNNTRPPTSKRKKLNTLHATTT
jgi:SAGA-associated factor 11